MDEQIDETAFGLPPATYKSRKPNTYCVESLEPVSPNVPSAAAENQYRHEDDQKIGGVHIVLLDIIRDLIRRLHYQV